MIAVNIRGTGGSGKSTLVKNIMALYPVPDPSMVEGRKRRMGTRLFRDIEKPAELYVPGHYDTACGGCDTIKTVDDVYHQVREQLEKGTNVLYEGIMVQDDVRRAVELDKWLRTKPAFVDGYSSHEPRLNVILLSTPVEECLAAIRGRRAAAGNEKPLSEKNTRGRYESCLRTYARLKDAGVAVERLSRDDAFNRVRELLGV